MNISQKFLCIPIFLLFFCTFSVNSEEQQDSSFIIVGAALNNEYRGSDDYSVVPFIVSNFSVGSVGVELEGLTFRAQLFDYSNWEFGFTAEYDFGRDEDVDNEVVASLREIDSTINTGAYAFYQDNSVFKQGDEFEFRLSALVDSGDAHEGAYATLGAAYTLPMKSQWRIQFELETTYANDDYIDTYFGIDEENSLLSGLPIYDADSSFRDVTLSTSIGYFTKSNWGVFARLSASKLLGDAKDSPIVDIGSSNQYLFGIGAYYRF
ncbi:MipA/OmpV family protein [Alteromonadaceae bacterium M269]|nr:MipA/OmpV family protein [Alteromonadaceae bacterium M269]